MRRLKSGRNSYKTRNQFSQTKITLNKRNADRTNGTPTQTQQRNATTKEQGSASDRENGTTNNGIKTDN